MKPMYAEIAFGYNYDKAVHMEKLITTRKLPLHNPFSTTINEYVLPYTCRQKKRFRLSISMIICAVLLWN